MITSESQTGRVLWVLLSATLLGLTVLGISPALAAPAVYRSVDHDGTIILSDQPPGGGRSGRRNGGKAFSETRRMRPPHTGQPSGVAATFTVVPGSGGPPKPVGMGTPPESTISYEYYPVSGMTAVAAMNEAAHLGPMDEVEGRRYPAQTQWSIGWGYEYEYFVTPLEADGGWVVTAEVRSVRVIHDVHVILPRPDGSLAWNDRDWSHWELYLQGLREHENAHVRISVDEGVENGIVKDLTGLYEFEWPTAPHPPGRDQVRAAVEEEVYALGSRWIQLVKSRNDEFDRLTRHGLEPAPGTSYLAALGLGKDP